MPQNGCIEMEFAAGVPCRILIPIFRPAGIPYTFVLRALVPWWRRITQLTYDVISWAKNNRIILFFIA